MSGSFPKKSRHQLTGPTLSQDSYKDWALWRLSLVLKEISESLIPDAKKEESPREAPAEDTLTGGDEESNSHE